MDGPTEQPVSRPNNDSAKLESATLNITLIIDGISHYVYSLSDEILMKTGCGR